MLRIIAVEGDTADADLLKEALRLSASNYAITIFEEAESALRYLFDHRTGESHFIVLDLKLPGRSGLEFLRAVKADDELRKIPVAIVTASENPDDVVSAYALHASCYIVKRPVPDDQLFALRTMVEFWDSVAWLPSAQGLEGGRP